MFSFILKLCFCKNFFDSRKFFLKFSLDDKPATDKDKQI